MYGGHQYAAVRLPADKVCVFGKEFSMEYLSDYEDSIVSQKLESLPEEKGFPVYGKNKDKQDKYPLCFAPDKNVSLQDVMELIRNRYEGTKYSPDETGRTDMRVMGTDTALSVRNEK